MPGKKYRSIKRPKVYEGLRRRGMSKRSAARISNAQARSRHGKKRTTRSSRITSKRRDTRTKKK